MCPRRHSCAKLHHHEDTSVSVKVLLCQAQPPRGHKCVREGTPVPNSITTRTQVCPRRHFGAKLHHYEDASVSATALLCQAPPLRGHMCVRDGTPVPSSTTTRTHVCPRRHSCAKLHHHEDTSVSVKALLCQAPPPRGHKCVREGTPVPSSTTTRTQVCPRRHSGAKLHYHEDTRVSVKVLLCQALQPRGHSCVRDGTPVPSSTRILLCA